MLPFSEVIVEAPVSRDDEAGRNGIDAAGTAPSLGRRARRFPRFVEERSPESIEVVGVSAAIRRCLREVDLLAPASVPVLLAGETGTGKDLFARLLHQRSHREGPFVTVDCAALPEMLLESTLFGHERGAYTGADRRVLGRLETARGGTVLIDDVGDLPLHGQANLLRLLETGSLLRLGSQVARHTDVRILVSTRRDLTASVRLGAFREDLHRRLATCTIQLPPLRERAEDIALLAHYFLERLHTRLRGIADTSLAAAEEYAWPGNARELRNAVERAAILASGPSLTLDLPRPQGGDLSVETPSGAGLAAQVRDFKIRAITRALAQTGGNRTQAAKLLGLDPASLFRTARRLGLWPAGEP